MCSLPKTVFLQFALEAQGCLEDPCGRVTVWNPVKEGFIRGIGFCRFPERTYAFRSNS